MKKLKLFVATVVALTSLVQPVVAQECLPRVTDVRRCPKTQKHECLERVADERNCLKVIYLPFVAVQP